MGFFNLYGRVLSVSFCFAIHLYLAMQCICIILNERQETEVRKMPGIGYECKDCGRAFLVYEEEKRELKCPSCEGINVAKKKDLPLPEWLMKLQNKRSSC